MSSTESYAVCIKTCELFNQIEQTIGTRLSIGDLVKILIDCDRSVIKFFDRKTQCFQSTLYQCEKANLREIPSNMWSFVQRIKEESVVKVQIVLSGEEVIVSFQVKYFGDVPSQGPGQFYGLQIMLTPNLTEENILELNRTYLNPTLNLFILRADKLILNLVVSDETILGETINTYCVERTIYITNPKNIVQDFHLVPPIGINQNLVDYKLQPNAVQEQTVIPEAIRKMIERRASESSNGYTSMDSTQSNMRIFVLPKVTDNEDSTITKSRKWQKNQRNTRTNNRECKSNCFDCGKTDEDLIQLNCTHIFCSKCLINSLNNHNLEMSYCPYKNQYYNCSYKLKVDDIRHILDIVNGELIKQPELSQPKIIFHKCNGCQFTSNTGDRSIYQCSNCNLWNNIISEKDVANVETPPKNIIPTPPPQTRAIITPEAWTCSYCKYDENLIDSMACVICDKRNAKLVPKSYKTEYYRLLELEENDLFIPNFEEFYCIFCDQMIAPENGVMLRSCLHNVCLTCIVTHIEQQNQPEIKCPHSICQHLLEVREIKTLISPEAYAKYLDTSFNIAKMKIANGFQCCVPGCVGFWECVDGNSKYNCPKCNIENCIPCKASHPGIDCIAFKAQTK